MIYLVIIISVLLILMFGIFAWGQYTFMKTHYEEDLPQVPKVLVQYKPEMTRKERSKARIKAMLDMQIAQRVAELDFHEDDPGTYRKTG